MLSGPGQFSENETNEVNFREIPSHVLQKVCMYFTYKRNQTMASFARGLLRLSQNNGMNMAQLRQMSGAHTDDGWKLWKKVFFVVGIPVIVLGHVSAFYLPDENEHAPPPFVPYDHLRIRTKKFPWGDGNHSLIHNTHLNV